MNIEEFVNDYLQEHRHDVLLNPYNGLVEFAKIFQRKMLEDAVEGTLVDNVDGTQEICLHGNRYGDKVRIIVIPNTEEK